MEPAGVAPPMVIHAGQRFEMKVAVDRSRRLRARGR